MSSDFDISVDTAGRHARMRVSGLVDAYTGELLRAAVAEQLAQGVSHVDLDASGVSFVDSGGLRVLNDTQGELEERGGRLVIVDPSETMAQILRITDLAGRFGL
jgi:anti-sigma B factor antagonist